jgi:hypothetical protein
MLRRAVQALLVALSLSLAQAQLDVVLQEIKQGFHLVDEQIPPEMKDGLQHARTAGQHVVDAYLTEKKVHNAGYLVLNSATLATPGAARDEALGLLAADDETLGAILGTCIVHNRVYGKLYGLKAHALKYKIVWDAVKAFVGLLAAAGRMVKVGLTSLCKLPQRNQAPVPNENCKPAVCRLTAILWKGLKTVAKVVKKHKWRALDASIRLLWTLVKPLTPLGTIPWKVGAFAFGQMVDKVHAKVYPFAGLINSCTACVLQAPTIIGGRLLATAAGKSICGTGIARGEEASEFAALFHRNHLKAKSLTTAVSNIATTPMTILSMVGTSYSPSTVMSMLGEEPVSRAYEFWSRILAGIRGKDTGSAIVASQMLMQQILRKKCVTKVVSQTLKAMLDKEYVFHPLTVPPVDSCANWMEALGKNIQVPAIDNEDGLNQAGERQGALRHNRHIDEPGSIEEAIQDDIASISVAASDECNIQDNGEEDDDAALEELNNLVIADVPIAPDNEQPEPMAPIAEIDDEEESDTEILRMPDDESESDTEIVRLDDEDQIRS